MTHEKKNNLLVTLSVIAGILVAVPVAWGIIVNATQVIESPKKIEDLSNKVDNYERSNDAREAAYEEGQRRIEEDLREIKRALKIYPQVHLSQTNNAE